MDLSYKLSFSILSVDRGWRVLQGFKYSRARSMSNKPMEARKSLIAIEKECVKVELIRERIPRTGGDDQPSVAVLSRGLFHKG